MIIIQTYLFFTFCRWMKDEETSSRILVTQIDAGIQPARRNSAYVNLSRRLEDLRQAYLARTSTQSQFLQSCSYTLVQLRMLQTSRGSRRRSCSRPRCARRTSYYSMAASRPHNWIRCSCSRLATVDVITDLFYFILYSARKTTQATTILKS